MNDPRSFAACKLFAGNIVVSGGLGNNNASKTVESFNCFTGTWTLMPSMMERRIKHGLVAVRSNLFVFEGNNKLDGVDVITSEAFDNICKKFVSFQLPISSYSISSYMVDIVSVGSKVFVFQDYTPAIIVYDVDKDEWEESRVNKLNTHRVI